MSSGPFSHDAAQVTFLFSLNQSNVITDQKQQFLIGKLLENCHSLHLCFRQLSIDWKTWYKCQARKTLFKWCQRTVEASSMATMEMGKASALLISRIIFKLFHSNSNIILTYISFFFSLVCRWCRNTWRERRTVWRCWQINLISVALSGT